MKQGNSYAQGYFVTTGVNDLFLSMILFSVMKKGLVGTEGLLILPPIPKLKMTMNNFVIDTSRFQPYGIIAQCDFTIFKIMFLQIDSYRRLCMGGSLLNFTFFGHGMFCIGTINF